MTVLGALGFAAGAFALAWGINALALARWPKLLGIDAPNHRSLHGAPVPRGGGVGIAAAIALGVLALGLGGVSGGWTLVACAFAVFAISWADDRRPLSPWLRLLVHLAAASLWASASGGLIALSLPGVDWPLPGPVAGALTVVLVVWMTNLYNFMDGMDGFAAGMGVVGFGTFGVLGFLAEEPFFAAVSLVIAGAAGGFLPLNFPPARQFMGDAGSSSLGFLAGAFIVWADRSGIAPAWIGALAFGPFVVDATVTLGRRAARGERVWLAHRTHYYQRVVQLGWSHRRTVLCEYALMLGCAGAALAAHPAPVGWQWVILAGVLALMAGLMRAVSRAERSAQPRRDRAGTVDSHPAASGNRVNGGASE